MQVRDRNGYTCLHHALSLPDPSPDAADWIAAALALPGVAALREPALHELASDPAAMSLEAAPFELFRGKGDAAQVIFFAGGWVDPVIRTAHATCVHASTTPRS